MDRAYALAKVESKHGFYVDLLFPVDGTIPIIFYPDAIRDLIKDMHERGHVIGLHYCVKRSTDIQEVHQIKKEMDILSEMFGFRSHSFLYTVRLGCALRENIKLPRNPECIPGRVFHLCRKK